MLRTLSAPRSAKFWPGALVILVWSLAAASVVFWVLSFSSVGSLQGLPSVQTAAQNMTEFPTARSSVSLNRAWGVQAPMPETSVVQSMRFQLWGVVAGASGRGSALISVDGQPPRAFRVGQTVSDGMVLQSLGPKMAQLGTSPQGPALVTLSLPDLGKTP